MFNQFLDFPRSVVALSLDISTFVRVNPQLFNVREHRPARRLRRKKEKQSLRVTELILRASFPRLMWTHPEMRRSSGLKMGCPLNDIFVLTRCSFFCFLLVRLSSLSLFHSLHLPLSYSASIEYLTRFNRAR